MDIWLDDDVEQVCDKICNIVDENFTVVQRNIKPFEPQGRTIVYVLSESHFTVHTYPEHNYLTLDIYICNPAYDLESIKNKILSSGNVRDHYAKIFTRGTKSNAG
jgi:S-adenosylmethionine/arginine decarboxylase-like enzyme